MMAAFALKTISPYINNMLFKPKSQRALFTLVHRWSVPGRQPPAVRLRATLAGPVAAPVAPGGGAGAHPGHGRDAAGTVDGPAGHVRRPQERGCPGARGRHLPGGPAVQGERAERQRHRQHGGQDVASDRLPGPFAGRVLPGNRLVQRLLNEPETSSTVHERVLIQTL